MSRAQVSLKLMFLGRMYWTSCSNTIDFFVVLLCLMSLSFLVKDAAEAPDGEYHLSPTPTPTALAQMSPLASPAGGGGARGGVTEASAGGSKRIVAEELSSGAVLFIRNAVQFFRLLVLVKNQSGSRNDPVMLVDMNRVRRERDFQPIAANDESVLLESALGGEETEEEDEEDEEEVFLT
jgi:hypothetical protein